MGRIRRRVLAVLLLAGCGAPVHGVERGQVPVQGWLLVDGALVVTVPTCNGNPEVSVTETATAVVVDVVSTSREPGDACLDAVVVPLDGPLGDRSVLDGQGAEVPRG